MALKKTTLRGLVVLELIDLYEEKEEDVMREEANRIRSKNGMNSVILQMLCSNYEWKT